MTRTNSDAPLLNNIYWINLLNITFNKNDLDIVIDIINSTLNNDKNIYIDSNNPWYIWKLHKLVNTTFCKIQLNMFKLDEYIVLEFQRMRGDRFMIHELKNTVVKQLNQLNIKNLKSISQNYITKEIKFNDCIYNPNFINLMPKDIWEIEDTRSKDELTEIINNDLKNLKMNYNYINYHEQLIIIYYLDIIISKNYQLIYDNELIIENYINASFDYINKLFMNKTSYIFDIEILRYLTIILIKYKLISPINAKQIIDKYSEQINNYINDDNIEKCTCKNLQTLLN